MTAGSSANSRIETKNLSVKMIVCAKIRRDTTCILECDWSGNTKLGWIVARRKRKNIVGGA